MSDSQRNDMVQVMNQMIWLPLTMFVYGLDMMVRGLRGMQQMGNPETGSTALAGGGPASEESSTLRQEETMSNGDQDLSGDDLKYVSYAILFTKRDLEATLEQNHEALVNYSTNGGSFGGLKLAKFMAKVERHEVKRPAIWKENDYPPKAHGDHDWQIPEEDERYITFVYSVEGRLDRQSKEYDKEQVDALRDISVQLGGISRKLGG